jgi:hypothetical protein
MKTASQKDYKGKRWYRDNIDSLIAYAVDYEGDSFEDNDDIRGMRTNFNLLNNQLNLDDFRYVFEPYGKKGEELMQELGGELPANFTNKDIISSKLNSFVSIADERKFEWTVASINPEAVSEKQEQELAKIREWVINALMEPIKQQMQMEMAMQSQQGTPGQAPPMQPDMAQGQPMAPPMEVPGNPVEGAGLQSEQMNPKKIATYMRRDYKDNAEMAAQQVLNKVVKEDRLKYRFRQGLWFRGAVGREIYHVYDDGVRPVVREVFPGGFRFGRRREDDKIHEAEWQVMTYRWTPSEIIREFGRELTNKEIKQVYDLYMDQGEGFGNWFSVTEEKGYVPVYHCVWRGLRKVGYLTYEDEEGVEQEIKVSEDYNFDESTGDISIEWTWEEQIEEGWRIGRDIYQKMGPLKNQHTSDTPGQRKRMPYIGSIDGAYGDKITSIVDRIVEYQYLYNIVMYRIEMMMASDKGKKVFMHLNMIPNQKGWNVEKMLYYLDANNIGIVGSNSETDNPEESDISKSIKEVDMSFINKIMDYINFAEYLDRRAGESIGIPKQLEAQVKERESVRNVQHTVSAATSMLEVYYQRHDLVKQEVLQAVLDKARAMYAEDKHVILSYIMDDMTQQWFDFDGELFSAADLAVYVNNPDEALKAQQVLERATEQALASQQIEFEEYLDVMSTGNIAQAKELMRKARERKEAREDQIQKSASEEQQRLLLLERENDQLRHKYKVDEIKITEDLKTKRELAKAAVVATGFGEDTDQNDNDIHDSIEYAKMFMEDKKHKDEMALELKDREQKDRELDIKDKEAEAKIAAAKNKPKGDSK